MIFISGNVNFAKYFKRHNGHGNGLIIKGGVRKGKTTLISLIVKILLEHTNFIIISNVRFDNSVYEKYINRIFFIKSALEYFEIYANTPYETPLLLVWDDSQSKDFMTSKGALSKEGKKLSSFLIFIGKFRTSYIYVAHQSYIPRSIVEGFEPYYIYKTDRDKFVISQTFYEIDSHSLLDSDNIIVKMPNFKEFDKYYLPILSTAFTDFVFNVDLDSLYDKLTNYDVGENTKECVKEYLLANNNQINNFDKYEKLKSIPYKDLYLALCLKRNMEIRESTPLNEIINNQTMTQAKKEIRKHNLIQ